MIEVPEEMVSMTRRDLSDCWNVPSDASVHSDEEDRDVNQDCKTSKRQARWLVCSKSKAPIEGSILFDFSNNDNVESKISCSGAL